MDGGDEWLPMESAPKDGTPIIGFCVHGADPYYDESSDRLTLYAAHVEGLSHVEDGPHVLVWGGGWDDRTYENSEGGYLPDWWFQYGSEFEVAANPVLWKPLALPDNSLVARYSKPTPTPEKAQQPEDDYEL